MRIKNSQHNHAFKCHISSKAACNKRLIENKKHNLFKFDRAQNSNTISMPEKPQ